MKILEIVMYIDISWMVIKISLGSSFHQAVVSPFSGH